MCVCVCARARARARSAPDARSSARPPWVLRPKLHVPCRGFGRGHADPAGVPGDEHARGVRGGGGAHRWVARGGVRESGERAQGAEEACALPVVRAAALGGKDPCALEAKHEAAAALVLVRVRLRVRRGTGWNVSRKGARSADAGLPQQPHFRWEMGAGAPRGACEGPEGT